MARDDMHVVMYTILKYLYDCLKGGVRPDVSKFSATALGINDLYWDAIVSDLVNRGYVRGVTVYHNQDSDRVQMISPSVTIEGVEFMMENSLMRRALDFLTETKSAIPFI